MTHAAQKNPQGFRTGLKRTTRSLGVVIGVALAATLSAAPAKANSGFDEAHSLRSLDIMLMVTALRCRSGAHDFQSDYHQFSSAHLRHLNAASTTLKRNFQASHGERNPARALDRMGVKIANTYGDGHPWLSCAELKQVTQSLSQSSDAQSLVANARYLLGSARPQSLSSAPTGQIARTSQEQGFQPSPVQITYNMSADWESRP